MKILILEASAEELSANKRVADAIVDALTNMCDSIIKIPWADLPDLPMDDEEVKADDE